MELLSFLKLTRYFRWDGLSVSNHARDINHDERVGTGISGVPITNGQEGPQP